MEPKSKRNNHIVMLPFMAHGHLIPFLALARQLHQKSGFTITIANTPLNVQYLRLAMDSSELCHILLAELPFLAISKYGLPPNTENSENLPLDLIGNFMLASTSLKQPLHNLLSDMVCKHGQPPLCIISDVLFGWANEVADSFGTLNFTFTTGGAYGTLAYMSLWLNLPHRKSDPDEFHVPGFPDTCRFQVSQLHKFLRDADGTDIWSHFLQTQISLSLKSSGFLCNTVEEIEPFGMDLFRKYVKLPVWATGSSISSSGISSQRAGKQLGVSAQKCIEFLDLHNPKSVLYISFGSQNSISPNQMMELAIGLEQSLKPFIWVIRPPVGFDRNAEFKAEWLPEGFEERTRDKKQGLLVRQWGPQMEILSHESTGGFLSHCGWNSVVESLSQGVPIIGWPLAAEQAYNSKMLVEEMRVSVELTRGLQSEIRSEDVKKVIEQVTELKGKGDQMRKKAIEIGKLINESLKEKGSCDNALNDFVRHLLFKM